MIIPNDPFIGTHYLGKEELRAVKEVLKSKSLFRHHGPNLLYKTNQLEHEIAKFLGVKHVLAVSNGAAAIKLACIGNGIGFGDEVLMAPFTFIASAGSVLAAGAMPRFVDIDETMNIDPQKIESKITSKTKAILAIHMQGQPCDMESIMRIARKYNLVVIEDTAQAFGSKIGNKYAGTFGTGAFSLQAGKTITCGEGGFLATNDSEVYKKAKMYHDNGGYRTGDNYPTWESGGTFYGENFKLTELQSVVALEQLKKIDKIIDKQRQIYDYLVDKIDSSYNLRPLINTHKRINVSLSIIFDNTDKRNQFILCMNKVGIGFNKYYSNMINNFDVFKNQNSWHHSRFPFNTIKYKEEKCQISENLFQRTAWFNLSALLTKKHLNYIIKEMNKYAAGGDIMQIKLDSIDSINNMDALIDASDNGTCFGYSWFLKLKGCKNLLKIFSNGKLIGFMPLFTNDDNSKIEQSTMYIPYGGFVLFDSPISTRQKIKYIRDIENSLAKYLANNYSNISFSTDPKIIDIMPFIRGGFIPELRYTYKLDLTAEIQEIYKGFGENRRREVRKAELLGVEFYLDQNLEYFDANKCVEWESKYGFDSSAKFVKDFVRTSIEKDKGMAFIAKKGDLVYGCVYVIWDKDVAYILYSYFDKGLNVGMAYLYYNIFKYLKESKNIKYIDFEGSVYEAVENYNISFGAYQCTYYNLHYNKDNTCALFDNLYQYYDK